MATIAFVQKGDLANQIKEWRTQYRLTQKEVAESVGVSRGALANWESGLAEPSKEHRKALHDMGFNADVGAPAIPAPQISVPIPYIGYVNASSRADWRDPDDCDTFEYVPPEWFDTRGTFACRVETDSMIPMIEPGDLLVFRKEQVPKIGRIVLFRDTSHRLAVKLLKHNGTDYELHSLNQKYEAVVAEGECVGFLIGTVRVRGSKRVTEYDPGGLTP